MKIDKRHIPSLFKIINSREFKLRFNKDPEFSENLKNIVSNTVQLGISKIRYIASPIIEAVDSDVKTSIKLLNLRNDVETCVNCYVFKSIDGSCYHTAFVSFEKQESKTVFTAFGFVDHKIASYTWFTTGLYAHSDNRDAYGLADFSYVRSDRVDLDLDKTQKYCMQQIQFLIQLEIFMQYAKIETKFLKPHHKDMIGVLCRYENKMPANIEIIDSTWYTNLIKSDAFKVRGHFRLQPCGEGLSKRKLVWINEFQKEGYTREAKKLQEL